MGLPIYDYVAGLDDMTRLQIMADYEIFSKKGSIGDCVMRDHAELFAREYGIGDHFAVFTMQQLTAAVWRHYALIRYPEVLMEAPE